MERSTPSPSEGTPPDAPTIVRHGIFWFGAGAVLIIITYLLCVWSPNPLIRWGPLAPMIAGAYGVVLGIEKIISGLRRSFAVEQPAARARARVATISCALLIAIAAAAGAGVWRLRAPYWSAIESRNQGDRASQQLKAIAERHAAMIQSGAGGSEALKSWSESATAALQLRPAFSAALDGATYLNTPAGGSLRAQAEIDARFFRLCLEWMDLYENVQRSVNEVSMMEPPDEWGMKQNDIIERIQALPPNPR